MHVLATMVALHNLKRRNTTLMESRRILACVPLCICLLQVCISVTQNRLPVLQQAPSSRKEDSNERPLLPYPYNTTCPGCRIPGPIKGKWVKEENRSFLAPVCCTWDTSGLRLNDPTLCGTEVPFKTETVGSIHVLAPMGGHGCECTGFKDQYVWEADDDEPSLIPVVFDKHRLCQLLGNRTVVFLGDSTMRQLSATIVNAVFPEPCVTRLKTVASDTLVGVPYGAGNRGTALWETMRIHQPDILVFGVGAHIYGEPNFIHVLETVVSFLRNHSAENPGFRFAYKTQQPAGCWNKLEFPDPQEAVKRMNVTGRYNWDMFYPRDLYAMARLHELNNFPVFDLRMLYSRTDAKVGSGRNGNGDCLHMCSPGPLEVAPALFQQLLDTDFGRRPVGPV